MLANITSIFLGFFVASLLDTTVGEFPSWAITGASSIIVGIELLNEIIYFYTQNEFSKLKQNLKRGFNKPN